MARGARHLTVGVKATIVASLAGAALIGVVVAVAATGGGEGDLPAAEATVSPSLTFGGGSEPPTGPDSTPSLPEPPAPGAPSISGGPCASSGCSTDDDRATFTFGGPAGVSFECSLDGGGFLGCTSPATFSGLTPGPHRFAVRATAGGATSPASEFRWTITREIATVSKSQSFKGGSFSLKGFSCNGVRGDWTMIETLRGVVHGRITFHMSFDGRQTSGPITGEGTWGGSGAHFEIHGTHVSGGGHGVTASGEINATAKLLAGGRRMTIVSSGTTSVSVFGISSSGSGSGRLTLPVRTGSAPQCS